MVTEGVVHKDVVIALLGASAALVGLILVFVGLVVNAYIALPGDTPAVVKAPLRRTAGFTLIPFGLGLIQIAAATFWLVCQRGWLYGATIGLFIATLVTLAIVALWTVWELVWD
jgi:hypothetical protein